MKILMVLMGMNIGGAETHVLELSVGLKRRGYDILVASSGGVYVKELEENGITHFTVPLGDKNPLHMLKAFFALKKIIQTEKPDAVHSHARIPSFILGKIHKFIDFNFVTSAHWVFDTSGILKYVTNWGYRTIAVSEDIREYLKDNYNTVDQDITVTINGINTRKFSPEYVSKEVIEEFSLHNEKRKIVYISRMDVDRSLVAHHLIQIAPALKEKEDIEIIIVGGGNDFDNIKAEADKANELANEKYIYITGARTDIYKLVSVADFFVGVSRSALEAMSCAIPCVIAGNEGYIGIFDEDKLPDCIETNFCCRGMQEPEASLLEHDMLKLLSMDSEQLEKLGRYSRNTILERYSVDRMIDDNASVYDSVVSCGNNYNDYVVSGYYGHNNSGDDALLHLIINNIRELKPDARFMVLSANPKQTIKKYGVASVNRFNIFKVKDAIKNSSVLISGGGSLIQDATSSKSLWYYLKIIKTALKYDKKVMLYANGIGPVTKANNKKKAAEVLENVNYITLRDEKSVSVLKNMGVETPVTELTADPAVGMLPVSDERLMKIISSEQIEADDYFIVSVREWKNSDFSDMVAEVCDYICESYGLTAIFVPMQMPDDIDICNLCARKMKNKNYVLKGAYNYRELMTLASKAKLVIGMRLHMLMYGANMGVPVIGLVYDPKVEAYLSYLNQKTNININSIEPYELKLIADGIMSNHANISDELAKRVEVLKQKEKRNAEIAVSLLEEK